VDGGLGKMVSQFLQSDDQTQLNYVRYGLDLLEDGVNGSLGELQGSQGAEDRIFLGSVQSIITALQSILNDPSQTPAALAALATDPSNILVLITLMVSTAFAAQISAVTLFGEPDSSTNRGLIGLILDFLAGGQDGMEEAMEDDMEDGDDSMEDGENDMEDGENDMEDAGEEEAEEDEEEEEEDEEEEEEDAEEEEENSDMEDMGETEGSTGGLLESLISFITGILGGNNDNDDMEGAEDGMEEEDDMGSNDDMEESEESQEEGSDTDDERQDDMMEDDASDGGSSFGGLSVSLHPIDIAALFVQVQDAIGMNCTCDDGAMSEEMITNATLRLMEDEKRKKPQKFKKVFNKKKPHMKKKKNNKKQNITRKRIPKTA